jgi:hypothetical protein
LLNNKNRNNPKKQIVLPFKAPPPNRILISLCRVDFTDSKTKEGGLGVNQKKEGIKIRGINNLSQLLKKVIEEDGSNLENKLFIIFIY